MSTQCLKEKNCTRLDFGTGFIPLTQKNFENGTYRILTPNVTYVLQENISFNPPLSGPMLPPIGFWFAAITVEADNVIIDLNGYTLEASKEYVDKNLANVYANIELGNSPYPGTATGAGFGQGGLFIFPGSTSFVNANSVIIRNGTLGRSSHWEVHGVRNNNISILDVKMKQFQVGAIVIDAFSGLYVKNVSIRGWRKELITVTAQVTALYILRLVYSRIIASSQPPASTIAQGYLDRLNAYAAANPQRFAPIRYPDGSYYGIKISSGVASPFPNPAFPTTPELCAVNALASGGRPPSNILIKNVCIRDLTIKARETVAINSVLPAPAGSTFIPLLLAGLFAVLSWDDAFAADCVFAPNDFLKAQAFALAAIYPTLPALIQARFPPNTLTIANAILTSNSTLFFQNVQPEFGRNFNVFVNQGVFGMRLDCASQFDRKIVSQIKVKNVRSLGAPGKTVKDICAGDLYPNFVQTRYIGNDVWGTEFATVTNLLHSCVIVRNLSSRNGFVFGIHGAVDLCAAKITKAEISNLVGYRKSSEDDIVNPSSEVYGVLVEDTDCTNIISKIHVRCLRGFGEVEAVEAENAPKTIIKDILDESRECDDC